MQLNNGLEVLEEKCFEYSEIKKLVLPESIIFIGKRAFADNEWIEYADLRAARNLKFLGKYAFDGCMDLKQVLLNEGLETISTGCFY